MDDGAEQGRRSAVELREVVAAESSAENPIVAVVLVVVPAPLALDDAGDRRAKRADGGHPQ